VAKEPCAAMQLATLLNDIAMGKFQATEEVPIKLTDSEKTQYSNELRTYRERVSKLETRTGVLPDPQSVHAAAS